MIGIFKSNIEKRMVLLFLGDLTASIVSFVVGIYLANTNTNAINYNLFELKIAFFATSVLFFSFFLELYRIKRAFDHKLIFLRSSLTTTASFLSLSTIFYLIPYLRVGIVTLALAHLLFFASQCLWRVLYFLLLKLPIFTKKTLILGTGVKAEKIGSLLKHTDSSYQFEGYISAPFELTSIPESQVVGDVDSIHEKVKLENIHTIVVALTEQRGSEVIDILLTTKMKGTRVVDFSSFYELLAGKLPVEHIDPSWLVYDQSFNLNQITRLLKRSSDLILSIAGLLLAFPVFPVIALMVRFNSPGPVFYKQSRVGEFGKIFTMYKFRTMNPDAEALTGVAWAKIDDPRVTNIGVFLRKTRLDELPQLINVLKGDMSFIGPRPERPELADKIKNATAFYTERHFIKPGLTGWAQINYPYGASFGDAIEKLRYDLYYIKNMSLFLDLLIIMETVKVVLFRQGGR